MKRREQKHNSIKKYPWRRYILLSGAVAVLALLTFVAARYQTFFKSGDGQMTSEQFYFTTDLLGDEAMVDAGGEHPGGYQYQDVQEGAWHLYGGGAHEISVNLRNYEDELRVTEGEISYTAAVTVLDRENRPVSGLDGLAALEINGQSGTSLDGTLGAAGGVQKTEETVTLRIRSHEEAAYEEGTAVEVTLQSTAPYKKTIKLHFSLYKVDTYLSCEIRDKANSPYAEMIIMTNVVKSGEGGGKGIQPYLQWSEELSIDSTNSMTFDYDGNTQFEIAPGMETRYMQIAKELAAGESRSIYFFKHDTGRNYSQERTIIEPNANKEYVIRIG